MHNDVLAVRWNDNVVSNSVTVMPVLNLSSIYCLVVGGHYDTEFFEA